MQRSNGLFRTGIVLSAAMALTFAAAQVEQDVFPDVIFQTETQVESIPGDFRLVTLVLGFEPGAWTPLHFHGGHGLVTVLEGEMTLEVLGQDARTYGPGDAWPERVAVPHRAGNESDEFAMLTVTFILPADVPTTVPIESHTTGAGH